MKALQNYAFLITMKALQNYAFYPLWACTGYLAGYSLLLAAGVV